MAWMTENSRVEDNGLHSILVGHQHLQDARVKRWNVLVQHTQVLHQFDHLHPYQQTNQFWPGKGRPSVVHGAEVDARRARHVQTALAHSTATIRMQYALAGSNGVRGKGYALLESRVTRA